jgi:mRNA interferase MazF
MATAQAPLRSEIWLVNFAPAVGAEIRKLRPALVINDNGIGRLALRIVVPITDWKPGYQTYPWFVYIPAGPANSLAKDSGADAFQVKSVSLNRFERRLGVATDQQVEAVAKAVAVCVGLP